MRKILIILFMVLFSVSVFAENRMTVGLWVVVNEDSFRERVINEVTSQMHNSQEWPFEVKLNDWNTDIHMIISGMPVSGTSAYAWSVTYTPIHFPRYTNGTVATSEGNISGMNWTARASVRFVEEQLYILMDSLNRQNM